MGLDNDNDSDSLQRTMILMWGELEDARVT